MELVNPRTGIKAHYMAEGVGEPAIFMLHGWTGNYTRWEPTRKLLAKNHRTIIYDLRGHGYSEKRKDLDFSFESFVEDHLGMMEALNVESAVLAGHSMGGMIAQHFALAYPEKVMKLVLVGTTACPAPDTRNLRRLKAAAWLFKRFFRPALWLKDNKKRKHPDLFPDSMNREMQPSREASFKCIVSIMNMDIRPEMRSLKIPTLVVASTDDDTLEYPLSKELAELIPDAIFETVSGCGHHIPIDRAEFLARKIEEFIKGDKIFL